MTTTKIINSIKTVFLATAAFTAVSTGAHADALADLKSVMANLNISNAAYHTAAQVPAGYSINPTADSVAADVAVEEPFVEVKWGGYIKVGYIYSAIKDTPPAGSAAPKDASSDFDAEAVLTVKASVQSSVGEVAATVSTKWDTAESLDNVATPGLKDEGYSAYWQFLDTMKLDIGRGSAGRLENGIEKNTRRIWTVAHKRVRPENAGVGFFDDKNYNTYVGLTYASGPLTWNVRVHDATRGVLDKNKFAGYDDDALGVSSKALLTTDLINFEMAGGYWNEDDAKNLPLANQTGVKWLAGIGTEINAIQGLSISVAAQTGELHNNAKTVNFSGSVGFALSDDVSVGIGAGWKKVSNSPTVADNRIEKVVNGGIYYAPLSQMIIGLEADWLNDGKPVATSNDGFTGAVVTRYSF